MMNSSFGSARTSGASFNPNSNSTMVDFDQESMMNNTWVSSRGPTRDEYQALLKNQQMMAEELERLRGQAAGVNLTTVGYDFEFPGTLGEDAEANTAKCEPIEAELYSSRAIELLKIVCTYDMFGEKGRKAQALVDGGSSHSFISMATMSQYQKDVFANGAAGLVTRRFRITGATPQVVTETCPIVRLKVRVGPWVGFSEFVVSKAVSRQEMVLGRDFCICIMW